MNWSDPLPELGELTVGNRFDSHVGYKSTVWAVLAGVAPAV